MREHGFFEKSKTEPMVKMKKTKISKNPIALTFE